jgi:hypothetical protein
VQKDLENATKLEKSIRKDNEDLAKQLDKASKTERDLRDELSR